MAKTVSDTLVVRIAHKGEEKVFDLRKIFNENPNRVISTVGTVNEDGSPNAAPMSFFYCPDERTIVVAMVGTSQTAANIKRDGRAIIEVLFGGDVVFGVRGRGRVIKEALECNQATMAVKIEVGSVKKDTSPAQIVTSGPTCTPRSERADEYEKAVWEELVKGACGGGPRLPGSDAAAAGSSLSRRDGAWMPRTVGRERYPEPGDSTSKEISVGLWMGAYASTTSYMWRAADLFAS